MKYLITGAGQIGTQLALDLADSGHEAAILRRRDERIAGASLIVGDAGDRSALRRAAADATAIFHCIHAPYSTAAWNRELPHREAAVMDVAAELGIPVIFPESVYAFGLGARDLAEDAPIAPVSSLGRVRARLLEARASHRARTASVVASDLLGPTSNAQGSPLSALILDPVSRGKRAWAMGDPDAPHAITYIPDLSRAMLAAVALAQSGGATILAPTAPARSQRRMAADAAEASGQAGSRISRIPIATFSLGAPFSPTMRELFRQRYLWNAPSELRPGRLTTGFGQQPTPWEGVLEEWARGISPAPAARP